MGVFQSRDWPPEAKEGRPVYYPPPPCALCIIRMSVAISIDTGNALCTEGRSPKVHNVGYRPTVW